MSGRFGVGDVVRVHDWSPPGHVRTPYFLRGHQGRIDEILGPFPNAENLAYGRSDDAPVPLYRVRFRADEIWGDAAERADDLIIADIYEHWLVADLEDKA